MIGPFWTTFEYENVRYFRYILGNGGMSLTLVVEQPKSEWPKEVFEAYAEVIGAHVLALKNQGFRFAEA